MALAILPALASAATPDQSSEAAAVARLDRYCSDPTPAVVARKVAVGDAGTPDPKGLEKMRSQAERNGFPLSQSHAWTMHDGGIWRLRVSLGRTPYGLLGECSLHFGDLDEAAVARLLASDARLRLRSQRASQGGWVREYAIAGGRDLRLLYWAKPHGLAEAGGTHALTIMEGIGAAEAKGR
jgi:hypothetical protein